MASLRGSSQLVLILGGLILATAATAPGITYLTIAYNREAGRLEADALIHAGQVSRLISINPLMWELEGERIAGLLQHYYDVPAEKAEHQKLVLSAAGDPVAAVGTDPKPPLLVRGRPLLDFGETVGRVEIRSSLRRPLSLAALILGLSWGAAAAAFLGLRRFIFEVFLKADKSLRESERKFRLLFSTESFAILIFDASTRAVIDINAAASKIYGYSRRDFLKLAAGDITAEPEKTEESFRRTMEEKLDFIPLRWHRKKDGTVFPVEISVGTFSLKGRKVIYGVVRDISERLRAEKRLLSYQRRLQDLASALSSAEERERRELAAVLHDDIGQLLAMTKLNLETAGAKGDGPSPVRNASGARRLIDEAIARTRMLTWELSSPTLYDIGLGPALEELCSAFQERHGLRIRVASDGGAAAVPGEYVGTIYRAVRELLFNAVKHAGAEAVEVGVFRKGEEVEIWVADDGKGFPAAVRDDSPGPTGRYGLFNIGERLQALGGKMALGSSPQGGAQVTLTVPCRTAMPGPERKGGDNAHQSSAG